MITSMTTFGRNILIQGSNLPDKNVISTFTGIGEEDLSNMVFNPRTIDNVIKKLQGAADGLYDPRSRSGDKLKYDLLIGTVQKLRSQMNGAIEASNPAAKKALDFARQQTRNISDMNTAFGLPEGFNPEANQQFMQEHYKNLYEGLANDFVGAAKGNVDKINNINNGFKVMNNIEQGIMNVLPPEELEQASKIFGNRNLQGDLYSKAKDYVVSDLLNQKSVLGQ